MFQICFGKKSPKCCETKKLKSLLSDDWSRNDKESWSGDKLGQCQDMKFDICHGAPDDGVSLSLNKTGGTDSLTVKLIEIELGNDQDGVRAVCPDYRVGYGAESDKVTSSCEVVRPPGSQLACVKTVSVTDQIKGFISKYFG